MDLAPQIPPRSARSLLGIIAALGLALGVAAPAAAASRPTVSAFDSLATIRSDQPLPAGGRGAAEISAAGNEFESFQIAVQAGSEPLSGVRVDPGATLAGPGGATIPASNLTIYREGNYQVRQRSDGEGATGSWPDALIPERDAFYGENRNAFPVDLGAGQKVAAWVDVLVPAHQLAGTYRGSVLVRSSSGSLGTIPLTVTVRGFSIPSTSTLLSIFQITGITLPGGDQTLFAAAGLNNRVTVSNLWPFPESRFVSNILPLLQGTDSRVQLPGAKLTALDAYHCATNCLAQWRDLAQRYPVVATRFFDYICDEPSSAAAWNDCNATAAAAESIWPGVRKLLTTDRAHAPAWATDLSPLVNDIDRDGAAAYSSWRMGKQMRNLWPYTSCRSFSCDAAESAADSGWPGYAIDQPASQARAMGWLSYITGATGELYYNTTQATPTAWTNQYVSGGNGDGTLFYPGTPDVIGGVHSIPVESIRLKRIRDGREDYEYLHILDQQGRSGTSRAVAQGLFPSMRRATTSPAAIAWARGVLATLISPSGPPTSPPTSPPTAPLQRTLTVSTTGTGDGSVTGPGINCPGDCSATFNDGMVVTLKASHGETTTFAGWTGSCTGRGSCQLVMSSNKSVRARFDPSLSSRASGLQTQITSGPSGQTSDRTPTFRYASGRPRSVFQCRTNGGAWRRCVPHRRLKRLGYGSLHRFEVRAGDAAGNWDPTPARRSFAVMDQPGS